MSWSDRPDVRSGKVRNGLDTELTLDQISALSADATDWVPVLTNLTLGAGTITAKAKGVGGEGKFFVKFTYGAGSAVGTTPTFAGLPFEMPAHYANAYVADVRLLHDGASAFRGVARYLTATSFDIVYHPSGGTEANVAVGAPFTWDSGDAIVITSYPILL